METEADKLYRQRVQAMRHEDVVALWEAVEERHTPDWESGRAFEYCVLRAFELEGAQVAYPYEVRDRETRKLTLEQIDGAVYSDGLAVLCEMKDWGRASDLAPISDLRGRLLRRPGAVVGAVFSRTGFSTPAAYLAQYMGPQVVLLWPAEEVGWALRAQRLRECLWKKYRGAVEHGWADWPTMEEDELPE